MWAGLAAEAPHPDPAMLYAMDISAAAASSATVPWPWLGASLALLLVLLAGLTVALVRLRSRRPATAPEADSHDDLPGFLESPPGSSAVADRSGWATLAAPPAIEQPAAGRLAAAGHGSRPHRDGRHRCAAVRGPSRRWR